ncbi:MAG: DUF1049 domain-containing protein [Acidimicrobiaceae bacterium]|nr:DUF1049 domain-containing protein [Acidimicrobiaceae bacterium]
MADTADGQGQAKKAPASQNVRRRRTQLIVGLIALVLAIIFIVENNQQVRIHFIFFTVHSRLWVGFLVSLVLGGLLGQGFMSLRKRRQNRRPSNRTPRQGEPFAA